MAKLDGRISKDRVNYLKKKTADQSSCTNNETQKHNEKSWSFTS